MPNVSIAVLRWRWLRDVASTVIGTTLIFRAPTAYARFARGLTTWLGSFGAISATLSVLLERRRGLITRHPHIAQGERHGSSKRREKLGNELPRLQWDTHPPKFGMVNYPLAIGSRQPGASMFGCRFYLSRPISRP